MDPRNLFAALLAPIMLSGLAQAAAPATVYEYAIFNAPDSAKTWVHDAYMVFAKKNKEGKVVNFDIVGCVRRYREGENVATWAHTGGQSGNEPKMGNCGFRFDLGKRFPNQPSDMKMLHTELGDMMHSRYEGDIVEDQYRTDTTLLTIMGGLRGKTLTQDETSIDKWPDKMPLISSRRLSYFRVSRGTVELSDPIGQKPELLTPYDDSR